MALRPWSIMRRKSRCNNTTRRCRKCSFYYNVKERSEKEKETAKERLPVVHHPSITQVRCKEKHNKKEKQAKTFRVGGISHCGGSCPARHVSKRAASSNGCLRFKRRFRKTDGPLKLLLYGDSSRLVGLL